MITEFKIFENINNMRVGDTVIQIGPTENQLVHMREYKILKMTKLDIFGGMWFCYVQDLVTMEEKKNSYQLSRFINKLEYHANKYNL